MFIIPTLQAHHLAKKLSSSSSLKILFSDFNKDGCRHFPDGEVYAKIARAKTLKGKRTIVLHAGAPRPNEGLVELELILQILRDSGAHPIEVFFAYFPYGMQDKVFQKGETNVAENLIEKLTNYYGVKKIYIVDAHFAGRKWVQKYPLLLLSALPALKKQAENDLGPDITYMSADRGGKRRTGIAGTRKKRLNSHTLFLEGMDQLKETIKNRTVAVVDDLVETGGTLEKLYYECKKNGAQRVVALVTHGVLQTGIKRIGKTYFKIYLTNTIKRSEANVDISPLVVESLS